MNQPQIAVIGGGPAGLAASLAAVEAGAPEVLLLERDREPGGILNQCIHDGFGNLIFGRSMTGPEYAHRFIEEVRRHPEIKLMTGTMVLQLAANRRLMAVSKNGAFELEPAAVVLAMGCRERSRFQVMLPGFRPAGVYTAGTAQRLINMEGLMPGERAVILGSGDIGLIMARRLTLEGAKVLGVFEILPRPGGLTRNIVQCLDDFGIPLHLSHTVTFIHGKKRLCGVSVAPVDLQGRPLSAAERFIPCDTLIVSAGLIPENELSKAAGVEIDPITKGPCVDQNMATSVPGIYAGGNVVHVHDLVDDVTHGSRIAGRAAARFVLGKSSSSGSAFMRPDENVSAIVPQRLTLPLREKIDLYLRVKTEIRGAVLELLRKDKILYRVRKRIVRPPEMIHLQLESSLFEEMQIGNEIACRVIAGE